MFHRRYSWRCCSVCQQLRFCSVRSIIWMLNVGRCFEMFSGTLSDSDQYLPVNSEVLKKHTNFNSCKYGISNNLRWKTFQNIRVAIGIGSAAYLYKWCRMKRQSQLKWHGIRMEKNKRRCTDSRRRKRYIQTGREEERGWRLEWRTDDRVKNMDYCIKF